MKALILGALLSVGVCFAGVTGSSAEEAKFELNAQFGVKEVLSAQIGKRVSLKTDSGETLEGTLTKVGDRLVHISKLSGKDFYDAVVVIDRVSSVAFKAR